MKNSILIIELLFFALVTFSCGHTKQQNKIPVAPEEYRRPENFQPFNYQYSLEDLKANFSEEMMRNASKQYQKVTKVNDKGKWKPTTESIDNHQTPEWFKDAKFGMFIDWGLWSVAGWAPKKEEGAMYPDWYELRLGIDSTFIKYHNKNWGKDFKRDDFIPLFTANNYNPDKLTNIAKEAGMKYIIPFSKHHGGFCLWSSSFTQRDVVDMVPGRDLIEPLVESCKEQDLKFGFYFSVEEWEYPLIDIEGNLVNRKWGGETESYSKDLEKKASGKIAVKNYSKNYLVPQATEFIDLYDPDIVWYDGDWGTNVDSLKTYEISAYFYNNAEGRKEVAVNDRYGGHEGEKWQRSKRGDFFTNEYGDMEEEAIQTIHAWEECRGISQSFGYNWQDTDDNVISSKEFIDMFVDIIAHGGNLLLIVNLDGQGALPKIQEDRLKDIGTWLNVNGEGIYATRPFKQQVEGNVSYTQSKDNIYVYVIIKEWPGDEIYLKEINAENGSKIEMLGYKEPFEWVNTAKGLNIKFPERLQNENTRPCKYAWVLKVKKS